MVCIWCLDLRSEPSPGVSFVRSMPPHLDTSIVYSRVLRFIATLTLVSSVCAWTQPNLKGRLRPMFTFVQANRPFRITCFVNHSLEVEEIYFKLDNIMVPEGYVNRTGSHQARLGHPGLAMRRIGVNLCCYFRNQQSNTTVKCHHFYTAEPPHRSLNISARINNWEHLQLNFTRKANAIRTDVYVFYILDGISNDASGEILHSTGVYHLNVSKDLAPYNQLSIRIEAKNRYGSIVDQAHFFVDNIVVPRGVTGLHTLQSGQGCALEVRWVSPREGQLVRYIISYRCQWEHRAKGIEKTSPDGVVYAILDNLRPYCNYTIMVMACGPSDKAACSGQSVLEARSPASVPGQLPQVTAGSYYMEDSPEEQGACRMGRVTIFWKQVPLEYHNAPLEGYDVTLVSSNHRNIFRVDPDAYSLSTWNSEECYHSYAVDIRKTFGRNSSLEPQLVKIYPEEEDSFPMESFIAISDGNSLVDVTWSIQKLEHTSIVAVTVYWCLGNYLDTRCQGPLDWRHCSPHSGHCVVELPSLYFKYIFAISVDTGTGSTGMRWLTCTYQQEMAPKPPRTGVAFVGTHSVVLQWVSRPCDNTRGYPLVTIIRWTAEDSSADRGQSQCAYDMQYARVDNLQPGRDYVIHVTAANEFGESSVAVVMVTTSTSGFPLGAIYVMVILVAPVLLLVIVGCMVVVRCIKKNIEKAIPPALKCEIPGNITTKLSQQDSKNDEKESYDDVGGGLSVDSGLGDGSEEYYKQFTDGNSAGTSTESQVSTPEGNSGEIWVDLNCFPYPHPNNHQHPNRDSDLDSDCEEETNSVQNDAADEEMGYLRCAVGYRDNCQKPDSGDCDAYKCGYRYQSEGNEGGSEKELNACKDSDTNIQKDLRSARSDNGRRSDVTAGSKIYEDGYLSGYLYACNSAESETESKQYKDDYSYISSSDESDVESKIYKDGYLYDSNSEVSDSGSQLYQDGYKYERNSDEIDTD